MIKPQSIRQIENKRFNKEFSMFPDLNSLKQFCKDTGITNSVLYKQQYREHGLPAHPKEFMMSGSVIKIFLILLILFHILN